MASLKVLCVCINGLGSSLMFKSKIVSVCKEAGLEIKADHIGISEGKRSASRYDVVCCSNSLVNSFNKLDQSKTKLISVKNIMSEKEIREKFIEAGIIENDSKN